MAIGTAAAIIGGSIIAGGASVLAGRSAAKSAERGTATAVGESRRQFDIQRADQLPFIEGGQSAFAKLRKLLGVGKGDDPGGVGDLSVFEESPGFQFRKEQGQEAIDRSAVSRGKLLSGQAIKEGISFASGLAKQEFGSFFDRLARIAGIGQTGAVASAAAGATSAGQIGSAELTGGIVAGNARTSAFAGLNNAIQGGLSNFLLLQQLNSGGTSVTSSIPGAPGGPNPGIILN